MVDLSKIQYGKTIVYKDGIAYKIISYYGTGHYKIQGIGMLYREKLVNAKKLAARFYLSRDDALKATVNRLKDGISHHQTVIHNLTKKYNYFSMLADYRLTYKVLKDNGFEHTSVSDFGDVFTKEGSMLDISINKLEVLITQNEIYTRLIPTSNYNKIDKLIKELENGS